MISPTVTGLGASAGAMTAKGFTLGGKARRMSVAETMPASLGPSGQSSITGRRRTRFLAMSAAASVASSRRPTTITFRCIHILTIIGFPLPRPLDSPQPTAGGGDIESAAGHDGRGEHSGPEIDVLQDFQCFSSLQDPKIFLGCHVHFRVDHERRAPHLGFRVVYPIAFSCGRIETMKPAGDIGEIRQAIRY